MTTLVSADAAQDGQRVFRIWSTQSAAFDAADPAVEQALADSIRELRVTVMGEIRQLK